MVIELTETITVVMSLLPFIIFFFVIKLAIKVFHEIQWTYDSYDDVFVETQPEPEKHTVTDVLVSCLQCGGPNKALSAYCEYCDSPLYIDETVIVEPILVGCNMVVSN